MFLSFIEEGAQPTPEMELGEGAVALSGLLTLGVIEFLSVGTIFRELVSNFFSLSPL